MKRTLFSILALFSLALACAAQNTTTVLLNGANYVPSTNAAGQVILTPVSVSTAPTTTTVSTNPLTTTPTGIVSLFQSYLLNNDPAWNGFTNDYFLLWQAAAFANVNGVPGASSIGNDLGLEVPIHKWNIHLDSVTRFEELFGDVAFQQFGIGYDYSLHQIHASGGVSVRDTFYDTAIRPVFWLEFAKASTQLSGASPFFRFNVLAQRKDQLELCVGVDVPLGPSL